LVITNFNGVKIVQLLQLKERHRFLGEVVRSKSSRTALFGTVMTCKSGDQRNSPCEPSNSSSRKGCCSSILVVDSLRRERGNYLSPPLMIVLCKFSQSNVSATTVMKSSSKIKYFLEFYFTRL